MSQLVCVRFRGDFACWTRPEMKLERVSYSVPTPSGARGMLEAIFWEPQMAYAVSRVGVVRRGSWFSFRRNEVSRGVSLRAARSWMEGGDFEPIRAGAGAAHADQRSMLALAGVEYLVEAEVRLTRRADAGRDSVEKYANLLRNRAERGKCAHRPALGCREFAADFELVRDPEAEEVLADFSEPLGLMLYDVFDPAPRVAGEANEPSPVFFHAEVRAGWLDCHPERARLVRPAGRA